MAEPAIRPDFLQPLDVQRHLAAQVAFDLVITIDDRADAPHFGFGQVFYADRTVDLRLLQDLGRARRTDAKEVSQGDIYTFLTGQIYPCNTSHNASSRVSPVNSRPSRLNAKAC